MITLNFDEKNGILESVWTGDIYLNEIIDYIDSVRLDKNLPRRLKILSDSRKANLMVQPKDLSVIVEANLKSLACYDVIIDAMIPSNPRDTAMSILYLELSATEKYFFKIFSSSEAALNWLKYY